MNKKILLQQIFVLWQWIFYPVFVVGATALCYSLFFYVDIKYWLTIPLIITTIFLPQIVLLERLMPYNKDWLDDQGDLKTDIVQTFLIFPLASFAAQIILSSLKPYYSDNWIQHIFSQQTFDLSIVYTLGIILLISDFFYYWVHRAFHYFSFLWHFHSTHHGVKRVYSINSGTFHFIEIFVSSFIYFIPAFLLGVSENIIILTITISIITGILEHVNINFRAGILNYIFNTAELHRWHHSIIQKESNSNFGKVLSIWDVCLGTFLLPKNKYIKDVGIEKS
jgi:sterol desaturase/sphingolipid hydroxylase (fatty acid hydroxylase superfamily)